jgi:hypothetical protein
MKVEKVIFVPGCFDTFQGTQEELNALIAEINHLAETGQLLDSELVTNAENVNLEELSEFLSSLETAPINTRH